MSGMLNTLLDINQIEAGTVRAEIVHFRIGDLLGRLRAGVCLSRVSTRACAARRTLQSYSIQRSTAA